MLKYHCDHCDRSATSRASALPDGWVRIEVGGESMSWEACSVGCAREVLNSPNLRYVERVPARPRAPLVNAVAYRKGRGKVHLTVTYSQLLRDRMDDLDWLSILADNDDHWRRLLCGAGGLDHVGYDVLRQDEVPLEDLCSTCSTRLEELQAESRQVMES